MNALRMHYVQCGTSCAAPVGLALTLCGCCTACVLPVQLSEGASVLDEAGTVPQGDFRRGTRMRKLMRKLNSQSVGPRGWSHAISNLYEQGAVLHMFAGTTPVMQGSMLCFWSLDMGADSALCCAHPYPSLCLSALSEC